MTSLMNGKSVLIVEDEGDIRELVQYNLEKEGFRVSVAETAEKGLEILENSQPDLLLLDIMLPGMDGLEVCRFLKSGKETSNVPIIMMSARGEESDIVAGLELGADDYITKPLDLEKLLFLIDHHIHQNAPNY